LTKKPMMYVVNVDEGQQSTDFKVDDSEVIAICAKLEEEIVALSDIEAKEYLNELGIKETGLDKLISSGYKMLNLVTYFTSGEPETRAWTVKTNTKAPEAAGVIHSDFVKGFVKADIVGWEDFVDHNGWSGIKETGKMRLEGKEYKVVDGDIIYYHIA